MSDIRRYLAEIGARGGRKSRRTLDAATARNMVKVREARRAIQQPLAEVVQGDGRMRRWVYIPEEQRHLRVILLADGGTVHNAFFDRRFRP